MTCPNSPTVNMQHLLIHGPLLKNADRTYTAQYTGYDKAQATTLCIWFISKYAVA